MIECLTCGGNAQLFICDDCTRELHDTLVGLARGQQLPNGHWAAGWIEHLADAATGQTRLGESARRSRSDDAPMRVNLRASELLAKVREVLAYWVKDLCDQRGVQYQPVRTAGYVANGADLALWLAEHVSAVASTREAADELPVEIRDIVERIEKLINRPVPPRFCGPCPGVREDGRACAVALEAPHGDPFVTCRVCDMTHDIEYLIERLITETDHMHFTIPELSEIVLPKLHEYVPRRTLYDWHKKGKLEPRGYRGLDGPAEFLLADVRKLRSERKVKVA